MRVLILPQVHYEFIRLYNLSLLLFRPLIRQIYDFFQGPYPVSFDIVERVTFLAQGICPAIAVQQTIFIPDLAR